MNAWHNATIEAEALSLFKEATPSTTSDPISQAGSALVGAQQHAIVSVDEEEEEEEEEGEAQDEV